MKKYIIITLITLMFTNQAFAETEQDRKVIEELENMQNSIFSAPITPLTEIDYSIKEVPDNSIGRISPNEGVTPFFKKVRIKIKNYYKTKAYERAQQIIEEEKQALKELEENDDYEKDMQKELDELTKRHLIEINTPQEVKENASDKKVNKFANFFRKKENDKKQAEKSKEDKQPPETEDIKQVNSENVPNSSAETAEKIPEQKMNESVELSGSIKKLNAPKDVQLDCDVLEYFEDRSEIQATGHPVLYFPPQDVTIKADRLVYNTSSDIIKAYGNVEIIKNGSSVFGDFIQINMNEETSLLTNMKADKMNLIIHAENVKASDNQIVLEKGSLNADKSFPMNFKTRIIGSDYMLMMIDDADRSSLFKKDNSKIKLNAKEINVDSRKSHDIITVKDADIQFNKTHLFDLSHLKVYTDKKQNYFEANYPEFGSRSRIGMFLGPGYVFGLPFGGTMKVIPFLNYKDKFGAGGAVKYRSDTNFTEFMYGSAENVPVLRGRQQFDDKFFMQYGINSYMDDWFMGTRMARYLAEFIYQDGVRIKNFAGPTHDLTFKHRLGAGYMQDSDVNRFDEKKLSSSEMGTTRLKYMSEIHQNIFNYTNNKDLYKIGLNIVMQGSAAVYGTGDTQFIGRVGPQLHTQYKYWMQDIGYFLSAYQDKTPLPRFDTYRYGHSSIYLRESLRLNKYLAVAWAGTLNLTNDAPNGKMFQENAFIVALGPDDFKVNVGYDFLRQTTYFGVNVALDMKGSQVNYDKLVIKNPDNLGKNDKSEIKEVSFEDTKVKKVTRTYAEVIDLEDPDKEQIE